MMNQAKLPVSSRVGVPDLSLSTSITVAGLSPDFISVSGCGIKLTWPFLSMYFPMKAGALSGNIMEFEESDPMDDPDNLRIDDLDGWGRRTRLVALGGIFVAVGALVAAASF